MPNVLIIGGHPKNDASNIGESVWIALSADNSWAAQKDGWNITAPTEEQFDVLDKRQMSKYSFAGIHAVVYSAGVCRPDWIWKTGIETIHRQIDISLTSPIQMLGRFIDHNLNHQQVNKLSVRRFVIVGSAAAETPHRGQAPYNAAKLGLRAAVATVAREVHTMGFRVFLIEPGAVDGTGYSEAVAAGARRMGLDERAGATRGTFGRNLKPAEVADLIRSILHGRYDWLAGRPIPYSGGPQ